MLTERQRVQIESRVRFRDRSAKEYRRVAAEMIEHAERAEAEVSAMLNQLAEKEES